MGLTVDSAVGEGLSYDASRAKEDGSLPHPPRSSHGEVRDLLTRVGCPLKAKYQL